MVQENRNWKYWLGAVALALLAQAASAQVPPYIRGPMTTNSAAVQDYYRGIITSVGVSNLSQGIFATASANTSSNVDWAVSDVFTNKIDVGVTAVAMLFSNVAANRQITVAFVNVTNDATLSWPATINWYGDVVSIAASNSTTFVAFNTADGKTNGWLMAGGNPASFAYITNPIVSGQFWTNTSTRRVRLKVNWTLSGSAVSGFPSLCMTNVSSGEFYNPTNGFVLTAINAGRSQFELNPGDYFVATNKSSGNATATVDASFGVKE